MRCLECGREVRNINYRHLMGCSGMTPREYLARHPGANLVDADVRASYGLPMEQNPKWSGGRAYRDCKTCGKRLSRHTQGEYCKNCQSTVRSGTGNHFHGQKHTGETHKRMVEAAKLRDRKTYRSGRPSSEQLSATRRLYWSKLSAEERTQRLATFIQAGQRHNKRSAKTKIENAVAAFLDQMTVPYLRNVQIGRYNVDFLIGEALIIECFGDYWYCNPDIYEPTYYHRSLHMTAADKWQRDQVRQNHLTRLGYVIHILWESEIRTDPTKVARYISTIVAIEESQETDAIH